MNCLFVGAGAAAEAYAAGLAETDLDLVGVCDLDGERARTLASAHSATAYTDTAAMLAAESAPLVVVLTSHVAHAPVTREVLAADRHAFVQKPLALEAATAWGLVETARERDLALGCAPVAPRHPPQRRVARLLADGRLGDVRVAYAHAHVGRVTEWHDDPESFLAVGPLYDGGVYPLALTTAWFGPVETVQTATADDPWPTRETATPSAPSHVEATLTHADGTRVRLTASLYVPHRSREFNSLELHGDDGSLYLGDCGGGTDARDAVQFGRSGRAYTAVPPAGPTRDGGFADGPLRLARAIDRGERPRRSAVRAAHVVAVCESVERAAERRESVTVADVSERTPDADALRLPAPVPTYGGDSSAASAGSVETSGSAESRRAALRLPAVGYAPGGWDRAATRGGDGNTTDTPATADATAAALDAGCRLLVVDDGTAGAVGEALAAPGAPARESLHLVCHVTTDDGGGRAGAGHDDERVTGAAERLRTVAGVDGFDTVLVGGRGSGSGVLAAGHTPSSPPRSTSGDGDASLPPTLVAVDAAPATPRRETVVSYHECGVRPLAVTPFAGVERDAIRALAERHDVHPTTAVVGWHVAHGVVPVTSPAAPGTVVDHLAGAGLDLDAADVSRVDAALGVATGGRDGNRAAAASRADSDDGGGASRADSDDAGGGVW
ncbi:Gfo/Idh/MocA family oxidoreductase [Halobaculum sp. MBLA0147]|uniref:Gfo/Idh/MocA family oxidoreductase n=1 Tax=Halobaculum sp. MBLA0147 TaxID=3079934 RepID=UPI003525DC29